MPTPETTRCLTLAQFLRGADWRLSLPHGRPYALFLWITRGQGRVTLLGRRHGFGAWSAILIPPGTLAMMDFGAQALGYAVMIPADAVDILPAEPHLLRVRETLSQAELTAVIDAMQREQSTHRPFGEEALLAHAGLLSVWLRRALSNEAPAPPPRAAERLAAAYCALIERDFRNGDSMADHAAALGVTPTHLSRTCRQTAGLTAADILTGRVLHEARVRLEDGDAPVRDVAEGLGFSSAAYFTRFIQKHTGAAPTALRRRAHQ
ncbi:AraC family transcriptional regulator [Pseudooceanicola aestuarii]|uniref:AraC family transcriptional regulator n=1 Tax=Pseudooceanicola aestuarii TaxID=2697319 RepID=UPI0013D18C88|nr:AraC family transcriptional regulator [Pseudooceanicola aestuarii]